MRNMKKIIKLVKKNVKKLKKEKIEFSELWDLLNTMKSWIYNDMTDKEDRRFNIKLDYNEYNCDEDDEDYDPDEDSEVEAVFTITDLKTGKEEELDTIYIDYEDGEYCLR